MIICRDARPARRGGPTAEDIIEQAIGSIDEYGKPFEVVRLQWRSSSLHPCTEGQKIAGYEDAIISMTRNGPKVSYRKSGSAVFRRSMRNGPYIALVAKTERNMTKMASSYRDGLWIIQDRIHDAEIKKLSDEMWANLSTADREYHEARLRRMHGRRHEVSPSRPAPLPTRDYKSDEIAFNKREMELARREQEIAEREKRLLAGISGDPAVNASDPVQPTGDVVSFADMSRNDLVKYCSAKNISFPRTAKREELVRIIREKEELVVD